jgi:hypothetical protein
MVGAAGPRLLGGSIWRNHLCDDFEARDDRGANRLERTKRAAGVLPLASVARPEMAMMSVSPNAPDLHCCMPRRAGHVALKSLNPEGIERTRTVSIGDGLNDPRRRRRVGRSAESLLGQSLCD